MISFRLPFHGIITVLWDFCIFNRNVRMNKLSGRMKMRQEKGNTKRLPRSASPIDVEEFLW